MKKPDLEKQDAGKVVLQELTDSPSKKEHEKKSFWMSIRIPVLAIVTGLILGAILIGVTSANVYSAFGGLFWQRHQGVFQRNRHSLYSPLPGIDRRSGKDDRRVTER